MAGKSQLKKNRQPQGTSQANALTSSFASRGVVNMPKAALGISFQNLQEQVPHEILQVL